MEDKMSLIYSQLSSCGKKLKKGRIKKSVMVVKEK
jgi:hypothetical protein